MHRRIWFLAVAAVAVLAVAGSAAATRTKPAATASTMGKVVPFATAFANTPRTPAARQAKSTITVAQEQDLGSGTTWNVDQANSTLAWATWVGWNPILRGPYLVSAISKGGHFKGYKYVPDLATKVTVNHKFIRYYIRKNANWNWGGKKLPVTYKDFVDTVKLLNNPKDLAASTTGVNQIGSYTHTGQKIVTFYWKKKGQPSLGGSKSKAGRTCSQEAPCGPFADYKDLLGSILPSAAIKGLNFNKMWAHCICGRNGKFVSDGPYYMSAYTRGSGTQLKANPYWYGHKPSIKTVNFKIITDVNSEIQAIRGGEVDAAAPQPVPAISALRHDSSINYRVAPGNYLEHIDLQEGAHQSDKLMLKPWIRQALMLGINRQGIINSLFGDIAPGIKPLNSLLVFQADPRYKNYFNKWNYNPQKAINLLKAHGCTGGPSKPTPGNTNYFTCGGQQIAFSYTTASDNPRRSESAQVVQANLAEVGVKITLNLVPTSVMFGNSVLYAGNYDMMEFAWGGAIDPGSFVTIWGCPPKTGTQNFLDYCDTKVTALLNASKTQLNLKKRNQDFISADKIMSNDVPAIPLYALPDIVVFKKGILNMVNNPAAGFTWNIEQWKWK